jgi:hypothetical protein
VLAEYNQFINKLKMASINIGKKLDIPYSIGYVSSSLREFVYIDVPYIEVSDKLIIQNNFNVIIKSFVDFQNTDKTEDYILGAMEKGYLAILELKKLHYSNCSVAEFLYSDSDESIIIKIEVKK